MEINSAKNSLTKESAVVVEGQGKHSIEENSNNDRKEIAVLKDDK